MKYIKIFGALLLFASGYLLSFISDSRLSGTGLIWLVIVILFMIVTGIMAIFTTSTKSFKKHIQDILSSLPF